jgi:hypothetical protein
MGLAGGRNKKVEGEREGVDLAEICRTYGRIWLIIGSSVVWGDHQPAGADADAGPENTTPCPKPGAAMVGAQPTPCPMWASQVRLGRANIDKPIIKGLTAEIKLVPPP